MKRNHLVEQKNPYIFSLIFVTYDICIYNVYIYIYMYVYPFIYSGFML